MNALLKGLKTQSNVTLTENGAKTNISTFNEVVDFFGLGAALRTRSESDVVSLFRKAFATDKLLALKTLFYIRDVRGGQGERKTFRTIAKWLGDNYPKVVVDNFDNFVKFGRWDDLFSLEDTKVWDDALEFIFNQFNKDIKDFAAYLNGKGDGKLSLLPKWMPSVNTSSANTRRLGRFFAQKFNLSEKEYRKLLAKMRSHLDIVERKMSDNNWSDIKYEGVPSRAALIYKDAFKKHDDKRYTKYIADVAAGKTKINATTLYPYDIVRQIRSGSANATHDVLWNALPNYIPQDGEYKNVLCLCDVSSSMSGLPMEVSISLGIYCGERITGPFKNHFLTFTTDSKLEKIVGNNISEKVQNLSKAEWGGSTNLQSAFNAILNAAIQNKVSQSDMPDALMIISDMEFDVACEGYTNFEVIKSKYAASGYKLPKIIFWNVQARNDQTPITQDDKGTCLVSGCSPAVLKSVLSGKIVSPFQVMLDVLNQERYSSVVG